MPFNASSLLQALAAENKKYQQPTIVTQGRTIDTRQTSPSPSSTQIQAQVANAKNAAGGGASDGTDPGDLERNLYEEIKYRKAMGLPVDELSQTGMTPDQVRNQYGIDKLKQSEGIPLTKSTAKPLENYLASVSGPDDYRTTMMQYLAQGGKKPSWYTGDYESDKGNIETSIAATMTPQQQLVRQDAHQRLADLQESRKARLELQKEKLAEQAKAQAAKQAGIANKTPNPNQIIPNKDQRSQALGALESALGSSVFSQLPPDQQDSAARTIAAKAKAAMMTPEGKGIDYETHLQDQLDEMMATQQLNPGKEGSFFGLIGGEKPSFKGKPSEQVPTPKESLAAPQPGTVLKGYKFKGGNPSDKNSWEKI
jgi:hypothetical protein